MNEPNEHTREDDAVRRIARLEERVAKLEARVGFAAEASHVTAPTPPAKAAASVGRTEDEFEFEVGQNWFAKVGIVVLTIGAGFMVSLPYASLPAGAPSLIGYALAAIFFVLARIWRRSFELVSGYLRGGAMALLYFATLRLYFFGPRHLLDTRDFTGRALLVVVVAANLIISYRRKSPWLLGLALVTGYVTAIAIGAAGFVLPAIVLLSALIVAGSLKGNWPGLVLAGVPLSYVTYFVWAANNPFLGRPLQFVAAPQISPGFVLACVVILAAGSLLRRNRQREDDLTNTCALLNCALGYGVFFAHTLVKFGPIFVPAHLAAALVFLGLAVAFWVRERSRVSTVLYAMTGYMALSMAIIKAFGVPDVFVWLSLQSVVVVATAIWFRSHFIVVANFIIYAFIVLGYILVAERESGISVGFGIVALLSARILNWQKSRLELKTELMRNAYLLSAFVVFPYALYHLVPGGYVGLAWVGLALFYYLMNLIVRSQKFRWMGHVTLLLTSLYLVVVGSSRFEPVYRVLSFLVLGTVLLIVSLLFTRLRKHTSAATAADEHSTLNLEHPTSKSGH
jgi:hypothetical protein